MRQARKAQPRDTRWDKIIKRKKRQKRKKTKTKWRRADAKTREYIRDRKHRTRTREVNWLKHSYIYIPRIYTRKHIHRVHIPKTHTRTRKTYARMHARKWKKKNILLPSEKGYNIIQIVKLKSVLLLISGWYTIKKKKKFCIRRPRPVLSRPGARKRCVV